MNELLKTYETAVALDKFALPWGADINMSYRTFCSGKQPPTPNDLVWCGETYASYQEIGTFKQIFAPEKPIGWVVLVEAQQKGKRPSTYGPWRAVSLFGNRTHSIHPAYCEARVHARNFLPTVWDDMLGMFVDNPHKELSDHIHDQWRRGYAHWAVFRK